MKMILFLVIIEAMLTILLKAEILKNVGKLGKSRGSARGKGGSMHINDWSNKIMTTSAIVTTSVLKLLAMHMLLNIKMKRYCCMLSRRWGN